MIEVSHGTLLQIFWEDAFLLGIRFHNEPRKMELFLELPLSTQHPLYSGKKPGEVYCYGNATLIVEDYTIGPELGLAFKVSTGPDGEADLGSIHGLFEPEPGMVDLDTSFGGISVRGKAMRLVFDP